MQRALVNAGIMRINVRGTSHAVRTACLTSPFWNCSVEHLRQTAAPLQDMGVIARLQTIARPSMPIQLALICRAGLPRGRRRWTLRSARRAPVP